MNLTFDLNEEEDILNTTIQDSTTGSVMYTVETPKYAEGTMTTTVTRFNRTDGSASRAFKILWKGKRGSLEEAEVVLDSEAPGEVPAREILQNTPGSSTYGSLRIADAAYRWKSKGVGSKVVLVTEDDSTTVAQSHSRRQSSFFRKPRDMSLEISEIVAFAVDVILLTFILVWNERKAERTEYGLGPNFQDSLPVTTLMGD